jgi:L-lactate dehydrogenase complex protein LldF
MSGEHLPMDRFADNAKAALQNPVQRQALHKAAGLFRERRTGALQRADGFQDWRDEARAIKDHTLLHLDRYLVQFEQNATARGTVVHWACDGTEAARIVIELCKKHSASLAVKSKSMTTEEISLNDAMQKEGIGAVETDLGEWILQLAGETPFHIVVPAIHKTRAQVGEILHGATGVDAAASAEDLTKAARKALRAEFLKAGVGISGANFAIAETGSILILENEGNARLCTTLPPVHIAIVGIEKAIPRLSDLPVFLRLLPRSGTGQDLTTYQSVLTGPRPDAIGEGPRELHVILMDNGRAHMLREEVTRQSLACIRCGACLNACPVYQQVGGHAYGSVYPGPIGAVITPQLQDLHKARELPFASSLCGACRDVCPVKIDIPELLLHLRKNIKEGDAQHRPAARSRIEALAFSAWAFCMRGKRRYALVTTIARIADRWLGPILRKLPPMSSWTKGRAAPRLAQKSFRASWKEGL